jgi:DNA polymerase-3 subunit gamma/tau
VLDIVSDDKSILESQKALFTVPWLLRAGNMLSKALEEMRWSDDPRLILELYLLRLSQPYASVNELMERIENFSKELPAADYSVSQPKAQVRETPVDTFADTEPEQVVSAGGNAEQWRRAMVVLRKEMPLTGNLLSAARFKSLSGSILSISVRTKFEAEGVKRKKEEIEAVLKTAFNMPVNLQVVIEDNASAVVAAPKQETIISDEEKVVESVGTVYKVIDEPVGGQPLPSGLEKILHKFPGKVKKKE